MSDPPGFVEVAVLVPADETYDYALPPELHTAPGCRVLVPYRGRQVAAVVLALRAEPSRPLLRTVRAIDEVVDAEPVIAPELLEVLLRAARDALCPPGLALAAAIPAGTAPRPGRRVELLEAGRRALERGEAPGTLGKVLWSLGRRPMQESALRARFPAAVPVLDRLERIGWIRREAAADAPRVRPRRETVYALERGVDVEALAARLARAPRQLELARLLAAGPRPLPASSALRALVRAGIVSAAERELLRGMALPPLRPEESAPEPSDAQRDAVARIVEALQEGRDARFLLYGITGSGKTEVYLRVAEEVLRRGRGAIVLVPEISLTHQVVDRFRARFGDRVAVLHSGLGAGERFDQWRRIREGTHPIAIGARSAVFAPVANLGLVAIDEEHDAAYKSEEGFRYHARELAELRTRAARCPLVLGSATPDVETSYRAECGEYTRLVLPARVAARRLPQVEIVDLEAERRRLGRARPTLLSRPLRTALAETLAAGRQAILFLNRRGFATFSYCFACGHALRCKHCDIALVYHATAPVRRERPEQGELRCHYCGYREEPELACRACGSREGALLGFGTERLEEELRAMFPHARIGRLDRDTSAQRGAQHRILRAFHRGELNVLIGTQMVAKGHDIPGVTLVGVVAADLGLHFPDFRAGERTFQLLTQVAGRAGRGEDPGRVVIQTFLPAHYAIALARRHDYPSFYREELARRRPHGYPPFRSLVQIGLSGRDDVAVRNGAEALARLARSVPLADPAPGALDVLGPAPAPLARLRDRFRWQLLLLGARSAVRDAARELARQARETLRGVEVRVDVCPLQML